MVSFYTDIQLYLYGYTTSDYNGTKEHVSGGITWHGPLVGLGEISLQ